MMTKIAGITKTGKPAALRSRGPIAKLKKALAHPQSNRRHHGRPCIFGVQSRMPAGISGAWQQEKGAENAG